jgi:hypothetical protein
VKTIRHGGARIVLGDPDPSITSAAGVMLVSEVDRVLGVAAVIDAAVGPIKSRRQGHGAGGLMLSLAEMMLTGGDFLADLDVRRADEAAAGLRAVSVPPASTTAAQLARRLDDDGVAGIEAAVATLVGRAWKLLPRRRRAELRAQAPTIDLDPTDIEVYGAGKDGVAYNYVGQRCGRAHQAVWAEAGWALAATLTAGNVDTRPLAADLFARAIAALPAGLGRPRLRADAGHFSGPLAAAAVAAGADFAIAAKRNRAVWRSLEAIPRKAWRKARGMHGAQVAVSRYVPVGWPPGTRTIVRRVRVAADDVRIDGRSRRRRTIDPAQLALVLDGDADHCYAYSFIVTNLTGDARSIEAWFRRRADIEERIRDAKWGMALRHLPSGNATVNTVWMWAALLALNLSAWMQALGRVDLHGRAHGKRLRRELIAVPARVLSHARQIVVRLDPITHAGPLPIAWRHLRALPSAAP